MAPSVVGVYHDDGIYVATAKALAEGHGYSLINLPGEPSQTKYPFFYPAVLALLWRLWPVFPDNLILLQVFSLFCTASMLGTAFLYLVRFGYFSTREAACACAIGATSPIVLYFATQTLSEPLFGLLLVGALWHTDSALLSSEHLTRVAALRYGIAIALPFLTRVVAAPVLLVTSLLVLWRKRDPWLLISAGSFASLWLWWILTRSTPVPPGDVANYYTAAPYFRWWSEGSSHPFTIPVLNSLLLVMSTITVPLPALNMIVSPHTVWIVIALGIATWWFVASGLFARPVLVLSMAAYVVLILLWPWPPARFLVPLVPLFLVFAVRGVARLTIALPRGVRNGVFAGLIGAAVLSNLVVLHADTSRTSQAGYPAYPGIDSDLPTWRHFVTMFDWLRRHSSADDVLASGLDTMLFLYTDRHSVRPFEPQPTSLFYDDSRPSLGTVPEFVNALRQHNVKFFVRLPMYNFAEEDVLDELVRNTNRRLPGCLTETYAVPADRRFAALAVNLSSCASDSFHQAPERAMHSSSMTASTDQLEPGTHSE